MIFVSKREVARLVSVSPRTIDNWMKDGIIPFIRIGRVVRFEEEQVRKALGKYGVEGDSSSQ